MMRMLPVALVLVTAMLPACGTRCERVCRKLLECGDEGALQTDRFSQFECTESCTRQGELFQDWEDEDELRDAWREHRRCLIREDCDAIADGVCYDDRFFVVGEE